MAAAASVAATALTIYITIWLLYKTDVNINCVQVSGYLLGNEIVNLTQPFAPGGDQFVLKYSNSNQVGGVSPAHATFYECRDL